ncbi:MAG: AMP-binding protein [Rhizobiales bacterium]|nr:AMP-binding protein [Hyphomicrobiales bacterium]
MTTESILSSSRSHPAMLPAMLARRAERSPDDTCIIEAETGGRVTYRELADDAERVARGLKALGVRAGDTVATMLPHAIDTYRIWFGLARLGALEVPIGTRYRGRMLEHILDDSGAKLLVVDREYLDAIAQVLRDRDVAHLKRVVVRGGSRAVDLPGHVETMPLGELAAGPGDGAEQEAARGEPAPHDLAMVLYTSGTTGPSKGVLIPWGQVHATVTGVFPEGTLEPGKVLYGPFPPNHIGGRLFPGMGIHFGVPAVIRHAFSASAYWSDVATYGCTTTALVSAMISILMAAPPSDGDGDNPLRDVLMNPVPADYGRFQSRFGVRVCTDFNMTEISIPLHSGWVIEDWRSCGRLRPGPPGYDIRIVDEHDNPVGPGVVGELVCRTDTPWALNAGYLGRPAETAAAWRNGWFHTGDAFRVDENGLYYFVDRIKDAIRRRGENISSFEIEQEVLAHPDVAECAAIGVPSELGEEDIKVFVVARPGASLTAEAVIAFVRSRSADFMVPRFVELIPELPRTEATQKVRKNELRARHASGA